ncbi:AlbA family DNA-binding domain-containing protein [Hymenobacter terrestris]|uniref:DNA binding domain-containing protein n=1 Tax=Hymenobacter terrestris TaxID=2748310 RepID=A0ABX2Q3L9_9BACT|nr:RNA-binding domain-containing protein [Hymenobacter terrestris]NVO84616.1 putative DNA binding domain-containing protein [Hymenobacter terrestris]
MDLLELIRQGEGERLEFKQRTTHPTRIARTLASLANTRGGQVLVGVDDKGRIMGVRDVEEELYQLREAARHYIDPPLDEQLQFKAVEDHEGRTVLVVTVPESATKPHRAQVADGDWRAYVRVRDQSVQTSQLTEKVLEREAAPETGRFERIPLNREELAVLEYLRQHPRITLAQYQKLLNIGQRRAHRTLIKLTLHGYIKHHDKQKEVYYTF